MNDLDKTLKILTYYHISLRNIGLYTSIAFAALIFSRYWRSKHIGLNLLLIFVKFKRSSILKGPLFSKNGLIIDDSLVPKFLGSAYHEILQIIFCLQLLQTK